MTRTLPSPFIPAGGFRLPTLHRDPLHHGRRQAQPTPSFGGEMAYGNAPYRQLSSRAWDQGRRRCSVPGGTWS